MTYCKNCHKFSKDDDFCSHCGSAVWGENEVSNNAAIRCETLDDHSHDKVTYTKSERGEGVNIPEGYKPYNPPPRTYNPPPRSYNPPPRTAEETEKSVKKGKVVVKVFSILIILRLFLEFIEEFLD